MSYFDIPSADIEPLKDELLEVVSTFLLREPSYTAEAEGRPSGLPGRPEDPSQRLRRLAHYISLHDAEFVLKVALYVRHDLNMRQTANFVAALCAREPKCAPFLEGYLHKIVVLPSDWLSIANFAYYYDSDALHSHPAAYTAAATPLLGAAPTSPASQSVGSQRAKPSKQATVALPRSPTAPQPQPQPEKKHLPSVLRKALCACFANFSEFSMAKYNNERSEKRRVKKWKRLHRIAAAERDADESGSASDADDDGDAPAARSPPMRFTYKQLIRTLHIQQPAFTVCCLLGKRYPATEAEYAAMLRGDAEGLERHPFDAARAGRRMSLPAVSTWETQLSERGNTGAVWDALVAGGEVPYMALLRNLRNLLTRRCAPQTHAAVLAKLEDEQQVAQSRQMPHRFLSAFIAVEEARADYEATLRWAAARAERAPALRQQLKTLCKTRERDEAAIRKVKYQLAAPLSARRSAHQCEAPLDYDVPRLAEQYRAALNTAASTAARLNVLPMRGSAIVIVCLVGSMRAPLQAAGARQDTPSSRRSKLDAACLLAATVLQSCEDGVVLLSNFTTYTVFRPPGQEASPASSPYEKESNSSRSNRLLDVAHALVADCERLLAQPSPALPGAAADMKRFPYDYLDRVVERRHPVRSLIVIDNVHRTYAQMNADAPSLGDLPAYLVRMRRLCFEGMVYVGVALSARPGGSLAGALEQRYANRHDVLVAGISDAILRLVAERAKGGGARAYVERADVIYDVRRGSASLNQRALDQRRHLLERITEAERVQREQALNKLPVESRPETLSAKGITSSSTPASSSSPFAAHDVFSLSSMEQLRLASRSLENDREAQLRGLTERDTSSALRLLYNESSSASASTTATAAHPLRPSPTKPRPGVEILRPVSFVTLSKVSTDSETLRYALQASQASRATERSLQRTLATGAAAVASPTRPSVEAETETDAESAAGSSVSAAQGAAASLAPPSPLQARPLRYYKECRFFISSTFLDMNNERNALTLDVFPRVRRWAAEMGIKVTLLEVDLRWGITEAATVENLSTSVCLNEVSRCAPFFIGMIGSRYGSCPAPLQVVADRDVDLGDYDWLRELRDEDEGRISVTELEMRHGIFNSRRHAPPGMPPTAVFFCRDAERLLGSIPARETAKRRVYEPDTPFAGERIAKLRAYVESQNVPLVPYTATYTEVSLAPTAEVTADFDDADSLGRWARRGGYGSPPPPDGTPASVVVDKEARFLTSQDVLLDMRDFTVKACYSLQAIVSQVCGVVVAPADPRVPSPTASSEAADRTEEEQEEGEVVREGRGELVDSFADYRRALCKLYSPPLNFIEKLAVFALHGVDMDRGSRTDDDAAAPPPPLPPLEEPPRWWMTSDGAPEAASALAALDLSAAHPTSTTLIVEGGDGDGKSSAMAALATRLGEFGADSQVRVVYYATEGASGGFRSLVLFLVTALIAQAGLESEFIVDEADTVSNLLQLFPQLYANINKRGVNITILLDGLEKLSAEEDLTRRVGWILHHSAAPRVCILLTLAPNSPLSLTLRTRRPPAHLTAIPELSFDERAELVRRHLVSYGKRLQETMTLNELKGLLRKQGAGRPSYLTAALMYLRLFSTYDTLRADMQRLPSTTSQLFADFFRQLERQFGRAVCREVLVLLCLKQPMGGIHEYNLYRLVSSVSTATRLVTLLDGTCLQVRAGKVSIRSSFFLAAITSTYLPYVTDKQQAYENLLAAELLFKPLVQTRPGRDSRSAVRAVLDSIARNKRDPAERCYFYPSRYSPRELLGILQSSLHAAQYEVLVSLAGYLPFLENLIKDATMLQHFMGLLARAAASGEMVQRRLQPIMRFLAKVYHVLSERPDLLYQCVQNAACVGEGPISRYSGAYVERLERASAQQERHFDGSSSGGGGGAPEEGKAGLPRGGSTGEDVAASYEEMVTYFMNVARKKAEDEGHALNLYPRRQPRPRLRLPSSSSTADVWASRPTVTATADAEEGAVIRRSWVRWLNIGQHGSEGRVSLLKPSPHAVRCMAVSDSGETIALGNDDLYIRVAPRESPELITATLKHAGAVCSVAFLPGQDTLLISGCESGVVYLWNVVDGTLLQVGASHLRAVNCVACHPSDRLMCSGGLEGYCMLWNVKGGPSALSALLEQSCRGGGGRRRLRKGGGLGLGMVGDAPLLNKFSTARLSASDEAPWRPFLVLRHHSAAVSSVAFHRSGEILATGSWSGQVFLFNIARLNDAEDTATLSAATLHCIFQFECFSVGSAVRELRFKPSLVVTCAVATFAGVVSLVDYASAAESARLTQLHTAPLSALNFSPDGALMASADEFGSVRLTYAGVTGTAFCALNGHQGTVTAIEFSPHDPSLVLTAGADKTLQIWRIQTVEDKQQQREPALETSHSLTVTVIAVTDDASMCVTGCADGQAFVFATAPVDDAASTLYASPSAFSSLDGRDAPLGLSSPQFTLPHSGQRITSITFGLHNTRILVGVALGLVYVWSASPGLNQQQGHLLFRVRAPKRGFFPIVYLCAHDMSPPAERRDSPAAASAKATEARVVALCSNSESLTFYMYDSSVSKTLVRKRRRTAWNVHEAESLLPSEGDVTTGGDSSSSGADYNDEEEAAPLHTLQQLRQGRSGACATRSTSNGEDTDEDGDDHVCDLTAADEALYGVRREQLVWVRTSEHAERGDTVDVESNADLFPHHRDSNGNSDEEGGVHEGATRPPSSAASSSPDAGPADIPPPQRSSSSNNNNNNNNEDDDDGDNDKLLLQRQAVRLGEEVIAAIPLHFECKHVTARRVASCTSLEQAVAEGGEDDVEESDGSTETADGVSDEDQETGLLSGMGARPFSYPRQQQPFVTAVPSNSAEDAAAAYRQGRQKSRLFVSRHYSVLVGHRHFLLASHVIHSVCLLPVQLADATDDGGGLLEEEEVFVSVSRTADWVRTSETTRTTVVAATTSCGRLLLFRVRHDAAAGAEREEPETPCRPSPTTTTRTATRNAQGPKWRHYERMQRRMLSLQKRVSVQLVSAMAAPGLLGGAAGDGLALTSVDIALRGADNSHRLRDLQDTAGASLFLLVGGSGGVVRILAFTGTLPELYGSAGGAAGGPAAHFAEVGTFFATAGLSVVTTWPDDHDDGATTGAQQQQQRHQHQRHRRHYQDHLPQRGPRGAQPAAARVQQAYRVRLFAGDVLGNVYQLGLVDECAAGGDAGLALEAVLPERLAAARRPLAALSTARGGAFQESVRGFQESVDALRRSVSLAEKEPGVAAPAALAALDFRCEEKPVQPLGLGADGVTAPHFDFSACGSHLHAETQRLLDKLLGTKKEKAAFPTPTSSSTSPPPPPAELGKAKEEALVGSPDTPKCERAEWRELGTATSTPQREHEPGQRQETPSGDHNFAVLLQSHPPASVGRSAEERKKWFAHQREVLKEAHRVKAHNEQACSAIEAYTKRIAAQAGLL